MDKTKDHSLEDTITRYALIAFAILLALIIYTYFTTKNTQQEQVVINSTQQIQTAVHTEKNTSKVAFQIAAPITKSSTPAQIQEEPKSMKLDDHKIPRKKSEQKQKQKLTDLLPKDLKNNIRASLITEKELKELSPEDQSEYKETQQKLAIILQEIGKTEAENQKLQSSLSEVKNQSEQLDVKVEKLRKVDR